MCASAQPTDPEINGTIYFVGRAQLNGPLSTATAFTSFFGTGGTNSHPMVLDRFRGFRRYPVGTSATFSPMTFGGPMPGLPDIARDQFGIDIARPVAPLETRQPTLGRSGRFFLDIDQRQHHLQF